MLFDRAKQPNIGVTGRLQISRRDVLLMPGAMLLTLLFRQKVRASEISNLRGYFTLPELLEQGIRDGAAIGTRKSHRCYSSECIFNL